MGVFQVLTFLTALHSAAAYRGDKNADTEFATLYVDGSISFQQNLTDEAHAPEGTVFTNAEVAEAFDKYVAAGKPLETWTKLPQGVLGPLPKGWQDMVGDVVKSLGVLDRVKDYDYDKFIGGCISLQLDGNFAPDYYPIMATKDAMNWPARTEEQVRSSSPQVGPALVDHVMTNIGEGLPAMAAHGIELKLVCYEDTKFMVKASDLEPVKMAAGTPFGVVPSWGGTPQEKAADEEDCYIVPECQKVSKGCAKGVADGGKSGGVYMCNTDKAGACINHIAL